MSDYKSVFYNNYVSRFKKEESSRSINELQKYWQWCRYKFSPLLADLQKSDPILELGCGPGYVLDFLYQSGFTNIEGIDISAEQIAQVKNPNIHAMVGDAFEFLAKAENNYSAIIALDFIEHFSKDEAIKIMELIHKALKPNGILVLQTPNGQGMAPFEIIYGDLTHSTIFTPNSLKQLLGLNSFHSIRFFEVGPVPKNVSGIIRVALWKAIKIGANIIRMIEIGKRQSIWTENMICCCRNSSKSY
jgi:2-polyprenyl-3-methyl-5-hydroxy-6-metoxy-1,4-benzoquinol methylase